jgi:hypothetical protein
MALENFTGFDTGEGMSEAAFEAFKEQMKAAAAQIAAIKKEEKKRKQKEDELLKILLKFVKTSSNRELVLLISRALEQNLPANFILAIIVLGNKEIQESLKSFLMLKAGEDAMKEPKNDQADFTKSLTFFREDETLPLKVKIELDAWVKELMAQAEETPQKLLKTAYDIEFIELTDEDTSFDDKKYQEKKTIKTVLIQLIAFVLRDFLEQYTIQTPYEKLTTFAEFILKGILTKTEESLSGRKLLD